MDLSQIKFKLSTPYVSISEKLSFLQQYVSSTAQYLYNKKGDIGLDLNIESKQFEDKILNRISTYLKYGTISIGGIKIPSSYTKQDAIDLLRAMIDELNIKFDLYIKTNPTLITSIKNKILDGQKMLDNVVIKEYEDKIEELTDAQFEAQKGKTVSYQELIAERYTVAQKSLMQFEPIKLNPVVRDGLYGKHKDFTPHDYQLKEILNKEFIRHINAFDVGLGKTSVALLTAQNQLNLGYKTRVLFVVPQSTLSKWHKDAFIGNKARKVAPVYDKLLQDETLFVGLDKGNIDDQLLKIFDAKYNKVFMSNEAFYRIKMKMSSLKAYEHYLTMYDEGFAQLSSYDEKKYERLVKRIQAVNNDKVGKSKYNIYLEDLGFDLIIFDEMHIYKNSKELYDSISAKYLSLPPASAIGIDAQAKTWWIRHLTEKHDGVLGLTATPFTNSPIEIYSMLALVVGERILNNAMGVKSVDEFVQTMCVIESDNDYSVDGVLKTFNVFKGLTSLNILRGITNKVITFLSQKDVKAFRLPNKNYLSHTIKMTLEQYNLMSLYKIAYNTAKVVASCEEKLKLDLKPDRELYFQQRLKEIKSTPEYKEILIPLTKLTNEDISVVASPFNLVRKIENLILNPELNMGGICVYLDEKDMESAVSAYNDLKLTEQRFRLNSLIPKTDLLDKKEKIEINEDLIDLGDVDDNVEEKVNFYVKAYPNMSVNKEIDKIFKSYLKNNPKKEILAKQQEFANDNNEQININLHTNSGNFVFVNTLDYRKQRKFFDILEQKGIKYGLNLTHKERELYHNAKAEFDDVRGLDSNNEKIKRAKQIVFCDSLGEHCRLEVILNEIYQKGVTKYKKPDEVIMNYPYIASISGQYNSNTSQMQAIQDLFNDNDDNKVSVIIGNEKIQVGVDLQSGTQAIHHLTIGWTPDCIQQREGRGVRQGNMTEQVNIYNYDMEGTFDLQKRKLVSKKEDWIEEFKSDKDISEIHIPHSLSIEQYNQLISALGDEKEMNALSDEINNQYLTSLKNDKLRKQIQLLKLIQHHQELAKIETDEQMDYAKIEFLHINLRKYHNLVILLSKSLKKDLRKKIEQEISELDTLLLNGIVSRLSYGQEISAEFRDYGVNPDQKPIYQLMIYALISRGGNDKFNNLIKEIKYDPSRLMMNESVRRSLVKLFTFNFKGELEQQFQQYLKRAEEMTILCESSFKELLAQDNTILPESYVKAAKVGELEFKGFAVIKNGDFVLFDMISFDQKKKLAKQFKEKPKFYYSRDIGDYALPIEYKEGNSSSKITPYIKSDYNDKVYITHFGELVERCYIKFEKATSKGEFLSAIMNFYNELKHNNFVFVVEKNKIINNLSVHRETILNLDNIFHRPLNLGELFRYRSDLPTLTNAVDVNYGSTYFVRTRAVAEAGLGIKYSDSNIFSDNSTNEWCRIFSKSGNEYQIINENMPEYQTMLKYEAMYALLYFFISIAQNVGDKVNANSGASTLICNINVFDKGTIEKVLQPKTINDEELLLGRLEYSYYLGILNIVVQECKRAGVLNTPQSPLNSFSLEWLINLFVGQYLRQDLRNNPYFVNTLSSGKDIEREMLDILLLLENGKVVNLR